MLERLIIFTRFPSPGKTKTRLIPSLGSIGATLTQEKMTGYTIMQAKTFLALHSHNKKDRSVEIRFAGGSTKMMKNWLGDSFIYREQGGGDLGDRMHRASKEALDEGVKKVVIIGCDCPEIDSELLIKAFSTLDNNDIVLGPATDGGYYLIGLKKPSPHLFSGVSWGSSKVLEQTKDIIEKSSHSLGKLPPLSDVDLPSDLKILKKMGLNDNNNRTISVIIPTLNEENTISKQIEQINKEDILEVIVADGKSYDNTLNIAKNLKAKTITTPSFRSIQMNEASLLAKGEVLLFIHADTQLPKIVKKEILSILDQPKNIACAYSLGIESNKFSMRIIELLANLRSKIFQLPYGDQALFIKREQFIRSGGFSLLPIMEDYEYSSRIRKKGDIKTLSSFVKTSDRRWKKLGALKTTAINQLMILGFNLGVSGDKLANFYRKARG